MQPFAYPALPHGRRHGPRGYARHESYRPWLRDEFAFRCVYCLGRERWHKGHYGFHVDNLIPERADPGRALDYDNLLYACGTCNEMKADAEGIVDPGKTAYGQCIEVHEDGTIRALNSEGRILIKVLRLDNRENTEYRRLMLEIVRMARDENAKLHLDLMGYPDDMPDLAAKRPPAGNSRPNGVEGSFRARQTRGELAETY